MDIKHLEENLKEHRNKKELLQYALNLKNKDMPIIFDNHHLIRLINIDENQFYSMLFKLERHITTFYIPKKRHKKRKIFKPSPVLMYCQKWILKNILQKLEVHHKAKGFKKSTSIIDNAKHHVNKEFVMNIDIKDFFQSIDGKKVYLIFRDIGYSKRLSLTLSKICTFNNHLPQGAPTSPYISNIILMNLDKRVEAYAQKNDLTYTRYADDITLSGSKKVYKSIKVISKIIRDEGFMVQKEKIRVQPYFTRQEVTGLVVNEKVSVPKEYTRYLRQELYYIRTKGLLNHLEFNNKLFASNYKEYIIGKINFLRMVEPDLGERYLNEFLNLMDKKIEK